MFMFIAGYRPFRDSGARKIVRRFSYCAMSIETYLSNTKPKSEWLRKIGTSAFMFVLTGFIQSGVVARKTFETRLLKTTILLSVMSLLPEGGSCAWAIRPCRHSICPGVGEITVLSTSHYPPTRAPR